MLRFKTVASGLFAVMLFCGSTSAAVITLGQAELLDTIAWNSAVNVVINTSNPMASTGLVPDGARGTNWASVDSTMPNVNSANGVFFTPTANTWGGLSVTNMVLYGSAAGLGLAGSNAEGFGLNVTNWNNQIWDFTVGAYIDGAYYYSPTVALNFGPYGIPGQSASLVADFAGTKTIGSTDMFGLFATLHGGLQRDQPHFEVNSVPEPGTMVLLGAGLIGLAGWGRKKFRT